MCQFNLTVNLLFMRNPLRLLALRAVVGVVRITGVAA